MKCPKCDTFNSEDSQFCKKCATSLTGDARVQPSFTKTLETPSKGIIPGTTFAARYKVIEELGRGEGRQAPEDGEARTQAEEGGLGHGDASAPGVWTRRVIWVPDRNGLRDRRGP